MSEQTSLIEPERAPRHVEDYFTGFLATFCFGLKPTAAQKREAAKLAATLGIQAVALKRNGVVTS